MNQKQKELVKVFIFLFIFSFIVINWEEVSWIFNYKELYGLAYDFFNPYPDQNDTLLSDITLASISPEAIQTQASYDKIITALQIPAIDLSTPVIQAESTDRTILAQELDQGAVDYPGSVLPGDNGQIVILSHSAPPNWPCVKHDCNFSKLENLNVGDQIILQSSDHQYIYLVKDKKIIPKGGDISSPLLTGQNNIVTLVSCYPPGKNIQRIAVTAELLKQ